MRLPAGLPVQSNMMLFRAFEFGLAKERAMNWRDRAGEHFRAGVCGLKAQEYSRWWAEKARRAWAELTAAKDCTP
jgi:hypothetical protein